MDNISLGTPDSSLDSGTGNVLGTLLAGGLTIGNTIAQGQVAKQAGKQVKSNSTTILLIAGGGGLLVLILVLAVVFRPRR